MNKVKEILLVDDSKGTNSLHSRLLKEMDVVDTISIALNGQQAIDYLQTKNGEGVYPAPVVIFLDNNMPVMDGYQFLEKYENLDEEFKTATSIVMVSSSDDDSDKKKTEKFPSVKHCLSKPLRREDVKAVIDEMNKEGEMKKINRVLLIDDSVASNSMTEALLKGIEAIGDVIKFSDPKEAIASIEQEVPDLILLDINMPGMNGFNFLDEYIKLDSVVKSNFSAVISMLSEQVFSENFSESNSYKKYGVKNYMVKPIDREEIEDLISEHFTG